MLFFFSRFPLFRSLISAFFSINSCRRCRIFSNCVDVSSPNPADDFRDEQTLDDAEESDSLTSESRDGFSASDSSSILSGVVVFVDVKVEPVYRPRFGSVYCLVSPPRGVLFVSLTSASRRSLYRSYAVGSFFNDVYEVVRDGKLFVLVVPELNDVRELVRKGSRVVVVVPSPKPVEGIHVLAIVQIHHYNNGLLIYVR